MMVALRAAAETLLFVAGLAGLVPAFVLFVETLMGVVPRRRPGGVPSYRLPFTVLVPAHNEATGIEMTLRSISEQLQSADTCMVVADNCDDDTAAIARAAGATVVERFDCIRRGKGYALDFGVRSLAARAPGVVIVVDADCLLASGALATLAGLCEQTGRPIQARYLMHSATTANRSTRLAEFAWLIKNHVRPQGLLRLGLPCQLMGTGMAFPYPLLERVPLASANLVEDMQLGADFASLGYPPLFCPEADVSSVFATNATGAASQRTRWEHGHLAMIFRVVPGMVVRAVLCGDGKQLAMALDLAVPPVALLTMSATALLLVCLGAAAWLGSLAAVIAGFDLALIASAVTMSWVAVGRRVVPLSVFVLAPFYALRKIPIYARFLLHRQSEWIRSKRDIP